MISEIILAVTLPLGGLLYLLHQNYNNIYKKYQTVFQSHIFHDTPEVHDPITLNLVHGQVPSWLNGVMYRVGPGRFNIQQKDGSTFSIKHAFDGLPFMHRFEVNGATQTLKYNSRLLAKSVEHIIREQTYKGLIFFGHIPVLSFPQWVYHFWARLNNTILFPKPRSRNLPDGQSVGVTATPNFPLPKTWAKKDGEHVLVSKTDVNVLQKIHAETLGKKERAQLTIKTNREKILTHFFVCLEPEKIFTYTSYDKKLQGQFSAAHHQYDPVTKEIFNFTISLGASARLIVFSTAENGKVNVLADITQRKDKSPLQVPYIHSLWLSENYVIVPEAPLIYKDKGINMLLNGSAYSSMAWVDGVPTYFHVISRKGDGLVASIPAPAFFTFHTANAFDTIDPFTGDVLLTLDSASFANGDIMSQVHSFGTIHRKGPAPVQPKQTSKLNGIAYPPKPQTVFGDLKRYKLNVTRSKLISADTLAKNLEFPRFNQKFAAKASLQYVYGCELKHFTEKKDETGGLMKVNVQNGTILRYDGDEGYSCSEPIFVSEPNATQEDEGVLLTLANNFDCCYLIIIDAKDMKELARFRIGQFIAVTFHGSYVDHEFESINVN